MEHQAGSPGHLRTYRYSVNAIYFTERAYAYTLQKEQVSVIPLAICNDYMRFRPQTAMTNQRLQMQLNLKSYRRWVSEILVGRLVELTTLRSPLDLTPTLLIAIFQSLLRGRPGPGLPFQPLPLQSPHPHESHPSASALASTPSGSCCHG